MPIQRVFTSKGHGTVITGIPVSGAVSPGDQLEILPLGKIGRVRALQAYKVPVGRARAGHSTAINLSDVDFHDVHRGMVAAAPGYFRAATMVETKVRALTRLGAPIEHQMAVRFHVGTSEVVGRIFLLEGKQLAPGEEAYAQFRLAEPVVIAPGDHYVFRQESPVETLGGGEVLDRSIWRLKMGKEHVLASLGRKELALGSQPDFVASVIDETPFQLVSAKELSRRVAIGEESLRQILADLESRGAIVPAGGGSWFSAEGLGRARARLLAALDACFRRDPYRVHVPKLELRDEARFEGEFFEALLVQLGETGAIENVRGGRVGLRSRELDMSADDRAAHDLLREVFREKLFAPPRLDELASARGLDLARLERLQALLIDQGLWVRLAVDVVLDAESIEEAVRRLKAHFDAHGPFGAADAKDLLGTTRKFAIPLLEHLDKTKRTRRRGDEREMVG
jgi:selenocysteine-specific elongation factor